MQTFLKGSFVISSHYVSSLALILISCLLIYFLGPDGVDWLAYSTISIDFNKFYFYREPVGWGIVWLFRDLGVYILPSIILSSLSVSSYVFSKSVCRDNITSFFIVLILIGSNLFLLPSVNGLRQGIALVFIFFCCWSFIQRRSYFIVLFYFLAIFSHNSAALFGVVVAFYFLKTPIVRYAFLFIYLLSSNYIVQFAAKNSNPSVTDNSALFFTASILILLFCFYPKVGVRNKEALLLSISVFVISTAFLWNSVVYERLIYYTIPVAICLSGFRLINYRPAFARLSLILFLILLSWYYSLQHPSVKENFLYSEKNSI